MDRVHVIFGVLLNLFSVQLTFCGSGETRLFDTPPPSFDSRSMGAQPFVQAQFQPSNMAVHQGIMFPQEHTMFRERIPEELHLEECMEPHDSMVHHNHMLPLERMMPVAKTDSQNNAMKLKERTMSQENQVPQDQIQRQASMSLQEYNAPQTVIASQERMVPQDNMLLLHTFAPSSKKEQQATSDLKGQNGLPQSEIHDRAVKSGYEYGSHPQSYPQAPTYGYSSSPSSYNAPSPSTPSSYSHPSVPYSPPTVHSELADKFLKPDFSELIKPVTGKTAGKLNGLVGLVLSLLGSGKGLELTGIKELLIDGILRPLLVAKGGLKALIGKLAIPVVALILINVEVLITVWWLWEDCPAVKTEPEYSKPSYPATPSYNYR